MTSINPYAPPVADGDDQVRPYAGYRISYLYFIQVFSIFLSMFGFFWALLALTMMVDSLPVFVHMVAGEVNIVQSRLLITCGMILAAFAIAYAQVLRPKRGALIGFIASVVFVVCTGIMWFSGNSRDPTVLWVLCAFPVVFAVMLMSRVPLFGKGRMRFAEIDLEIKLRRKK